MARNKRILIIILCFVLLIAGVPSYKTVQAEETSDNWEFTVSSKKVSNVSAYFTTKTKVLTEEEAVAKKVPQGYSGSVISVGRGESVGATLDFTEAHINMMTVESITFRFYVESTSADDSDYPEVRILLPGTTSYWAMRQYVGDSTDKWMELTIYRDGTNFYQDYKRNLVGTNAFSVLADEDGYLSKFEFSVRRNGTGNFYIDNVTVNYLKDDFVAPIITLPSDSFTMPYGSIMNFEATAYDEQDACATPVEYSWKDESKLDENGNPTVGEHILVVTSVDSFGNMSEKEVKVTVTEKDTVAPTININVKDVYVPSGTKPQLRVTCTDDSGPVSSEFTWSENALDECGRLTDGTHTYTITAVDLSGNQAVHVVTFHVGETNPAYGAK